MPNSFSDGLPRAQPSSMGVDADALVAFIDDVEAAGLELHGLMLHRHGHVVAEGWRWPYRADRPRILHSTTKSFTACGVGLAIEEGHFALRDKVVSFFPDELPPVVSEHLAAMTVEDLLTMRTGQESETSGSVWRGLDTSWIAEFFKIPVVHKPGSVYVYTSAASYMLSAIVTRTTGKTLHDYLKPRLLEPMGIRGETWDLGPDGINPGGNGLNGCTADMLKLGILHAQGGAWNGQRLLPEAWVQASTRPQGGQGDSRYGYHWAIRPKGAFSAIGVFMQAVVVYRDYGACLAITGAMEGSAVLFPHVEKHFPKAFGEATGSTAAADARLAARLATWPQARAAAGSAAPARTPEIDGAIFAMQPNAAGVSRIRFDITGGLYEFRLSDAEGEHLVSAGLGQWVEGHTDMPGRDLHHGYRLRDAAVVASAGWVDEQTLRMEWIFPETAFRDTVTCRFAGDGVTLQRSVNINSGLTRHPDLAGARVR